MMSSIREVGQRRNDIGALVADVPFLVDKHLREKIDLLPVTKRGLRVPLTAFSFANDVRFRVSFVAFLALFIWVEELEIGLFEVEGPAASWVPLGQQLIGGRQTVRFPV